MTPSVPVEATTTSAATTTRLLTHVFEGITTSAVSTSYHFEFLGTITDCITFTPAKEGTICVSYAGYNEILPCRHTRLTEA